MIRDVQPIITARFEHDDSHTLERYLATGGYEGLRAALRVAAQQVVDQVKAASLLGRGGAGFPAGVKWGFLPPGKYPYYVVVNGDESEPGTYKDRLLMERDPHQLIEGLLICCYAVGAAQAFLYVRGEMALAQERIAAALNEAHEAGYVGRDIWAPTSPATSSSLGRRRLHRRRGDGADREPRGRAGDAAAEAAVLPGGHRPLPAADDRQQRRDAVEPPVDHDQRRQRVRRPRRRDVAGAPACSPSPGTSSARASTRSSSASPRSAISSTPRCYCGGIRGDRELKAFIPGGASAPWFFEEHLDLPLEAGAVGKAGSMLGSGRHHRHGRDHRRGQGVPSGRALLLQGVLRQVHALP